MCGITGGIFEEIPNRNLIAEMVQLINHRGPDNSDFFIDAKVALGFARLSIIDPKDGNQPIYNEDQSIVSLCNGEIYNHHYLKQQLAKAGHQFNSNSDAEVIPHLYESYQEQFVSYLHGKFAIALYDRNNQQLILVRDPIGIKPLYYLSTPEGFFFSSEIKTFLLLPQYKPTVDRSSLDLLLTFKHIPGENCLLQDVRSLPPGNIAIFNIKTHTLSIKPYYSLPLQHSDINKSITLDTAKTTVCRLFDEAVGKRLMSDVPLGIALSGGLDSSAVVASVARQTQISAKTFFVNIGETSSESEYARMVSDYYKTEHHEIQLTPEKLSDIIPKVIWHIEEPMSVAEISTYYLGKMVSEHVKVLLCGEGSDELFGGYNRFQPINLLAKFPQWLLKWGYVRGLNGFTHHQRKQLYSDAQLNFLGGNSNTYLDENLNLTHTTLLNRLLRYEITHQLPNLHLMRLDKMIMASSVEPRVPFLDVNLVNYVANLPSHFKVQGFREKVLLKLAMTDRLPLPIIQRRKLGFANPVKAIFKSDFRNVCHDELFAERETLKSFFSLPNINKLFKGLGKKSLLTQVEMKLFHIYLFVKWHQLFIEGRFRDHNL